MKEKVEKEDDEDNQLLPQDGKQKAYSVGTRMMQGRAGPALVQQSRQGGQNRGQTNSIRNQSFKNGNDFFNSAKDAHPGQGSGDFQKSFSNYSHSIFKGKQMGNSSNENMSHSTSANASKSQVRAFRKY